MVHRCAVTLRARIAADPGLRMLHDELERRADGDAAHDVAHCLRVAEWTLRIGADEVDAREAIAAALLHDIVNLPKDHPERASASALAAEEARRLLPMAGFDDVAVQRIAEAVRDHSYSRGAQPHSVLGRALQDADRLEALGALGLLRTAATGARLGAAFAHPSDPWARARELDDLRYTVDHFFTKLLGLPRTMCTEAGRAEAQRRVRFMEQFLDQLARELGEPRTATSASATID